MVSLSVRKQPAVAGDGLRPVNLKTDLAPLADLIELVFADSMDNSGRAAIREMRYLSRMGPGLSMIIGMNDLVQGVSLGYVWVAEGKLVGNISIYQAAQWPRELGHAWIIANVAVHPEYRRRGIARQLMAASMDAISARSRGKRGPAHAVLQVEAHNPAAQHLYRGFGFLAERRWLHWRRASSRHLPRPIDAGSVFITRRRAGEWRAEYALAQQVRTAEAGGMGWLRPLHPKLFRQSGWAALNDNLNLRSRERLIIRADDHAPKSALLASLWIETGFAVSSTQLTLLTAPDYTGLYDHALLNLAVRRYGQRSALTIEHPADETITNALLAQYNFVQKRDLLHMRWTR
ncbi:MAG: GNAT family N-acetyltransferase [Chloroflexi bacterium]|nr:GNAT family N-acetyltransferase [Chloroflexota bacterium]